MRKNYLWYQFFRYGVVRPSLRIFYSDVTVGGSEKIPPDKPVIFVANHQNALMDALHVVSKTKKIVHFLTRAEPFQMPVLKHFFRSLNMLPVYRVRDGFSTIRKNAQTFEQCSKRLAQGDAVLVFAEANHDLKRRVRPLSKGFTRIAFGAEQEYAWSLDLQVQPVGLGYSRHQKSQTLVHVEFGDCIPVAEFREQFHKDKRKAAHQLKEAAAEGLKQLTMHVPKLEHYPFYHLLMDELESNRQNIVDPQLVNKRVSWAKEHFTEQRLCEAEQLAEQAEAHNALLHDFKTETSVGVWDVILSPMYLFALINNAIPYGVIRWVTNSYIEDHVFDATAKFLLGLFMLPTYYLIIGVVLGSTGVNLPWVAGYFAGSVLTAPLFVRAKNMLSQNSAKKLKQEKSTVYESVKSELAKFEELRENMFG